MTQPSQHPNPKPQQGPVDIRAVVDDVEKRQASDGRVIPEQPGCGPTVTDIPDLVKPPAGDDAQSTGSDA